MHKDVLQYQEKQSPDTPMGRRYYSGGHICRAPYEAVHHTSRLTQFRIVGAEWVREARGATTEALEITLKIDGGDKDAIATQMQPGLVFAFDPKNDSDTVDAVLASLKPSPEEKLGCIVVPVHTSYMMRTHQQAVPKRDALAGLIDLSRPTEQLVERLAERAEAAGKPFPLAYDAAELARCYTVAELLQYRPGLLTLEDVYANQPSMKTRPYTISDFDREAGTVNVLLSGVSAELAEGDPLGIKPSPDARTKHGGLATDMLMDIATGGKDGSPDGEYRLNGYLVTDSPRLVFPGFTRPTEALEHAMTVQHKTPQRTAYYHGLRDLVEKEPSRDTTLYLLATGSGMAPYMALLRDLSRQKAADPDFGMKCDIVLINGGRHEEDELYKQECRRFVAEGLVKTYHAFSSADGTDKTVTLKDGALHEEKKTRQGKSGERFYIQDLLEEEYGRDMDARLRDGKAWVYVCGTKGALDGVTAKWPRTFRDKPDALQHTASVPGRFFEDMWQGENRGVAYNIPQPVGRRSRENPEDWRERIPRLPERRAMESQAFAR